VDSQTPGTPKSVFSLPNGSGDAMNNVYQFGGTKIDGEVLLTLVDSGMNPIFNYPFEDLWIDSAVGSFTFCPGGTVADGNTDVNGQTTWTGTLFAGGFSETTGTVPALIIMVNGSALTQPPLDYRFNSADLNADLIVNLTDVVLFAAIYYGAYGYEADLYWDGVINLSDIVLLAQGMGAECP